VCTLFFVAFLAIISEGQRERREGRRSRRVLSGQRGNELREVGQGAVVQKKGVVYGRGQGAGQKGRRAGSRVGVGSSTIN
jgi:hypothetical protein